MNFADLSPPTSPSAWLDLDALDRNIVKVYKNTKAVNLRIATKSIRSIEVLKYIKARTPNYIGLMSYAADESLYLLEEGFENILCAYPTLDIDSVQKTLAYSSKGATMVWMADTIEHLTLLYQATTEYKEHTGEDVRIKVCLDINMSMVLPKIYFGTKRSALKGLRDIKKLLKAAEKLNTIDVVGIMGYEAQIAGLADHSPDKPLASKAIPILKKRSRAHVSQRRNAVVDWFAYQDNHLEFVNGGGSGSMVFTAKQPEITEVTVGSAYYKPAYFDYMDTMNEFEGAAGFVLPITRKPEKNVVTCQSGGYIASGPIGTDKQPVVVYPANVSILADEGFGEVQTPLAIKGKSKKDKQFDIGKYVWLRHAKAGELCEHFGELICYKEDKALPSTGELSTMQTYRGAGKCFH